MSLAKMVSFDLIRMIRFVQLPVLLMLHVLNLLERCIVVFDLLVL